MIDKLIDSTQFIVHNNQNIDISDSLRQYVKAFNTCGCSGSPKQYGRYHKYKIHESSKKA